MKPCGPPLFRCWLCQDDLEGKPEANGEHKPHEQLCGQSPQDLPGYRCDWTLYHYSCHCSNVLKAYCVYRYHTLSYDSYLPTTDVEVEPGRDHQQQGLRLFTSVPGRTQTNVARSIGEAPFMDQNDNVWSHLGANHLDPPSSQQQQQQYQQHQPHQQYQHQHQPQQQHQHHQRHEQQQQYRQRQYYQQRRQQHQQWQNHYQQQQILHHYQPASNPLVSDPIFTERQLSSTSRPQRMVQAQYAGSAVSDYSNGMIYSGNTNPGFSGDTPTAVPTPITPNHHRALSVASQKQPPAGHKASSSSSPRLPKPELKQPSFGGDRFKDDAFKGWKFHLFKQIQSPYQENGQQLDISACGSCSVQKRPCRIEHIHPKILENPSAELREHLLRCPDRDRIIDHVPWLRQYLNLSADP